MNYKEWLQNTLSKKLKEKDERINLQVYEHSNAKFTGGIHDCSIVINDLGGTTDTDEIIVLPIQLMCLSCGQYTENDDEISTYDIFYEVLKEFCTSYNRKSVNIDLDYYKMTYVLPLPVNPLESDSTTFRMNFVITGTLTISKNISDINEIKINNQRIPFLNARLIYATALSSSKKITQKLTRNRVNNSSLTLSIDCYNRNNVIGNIFKALRTEDDQIKSNDKIKCNLIYNDGSNEEYNFVLSSVSMLSDRTNPTTTTYEFVLY